MLGVILPEIAGKRSADRTRGSGRPGPNRLRVGASRIATNRVKMAGLRAFQESPLSGSNRPSE